MVQGFSAFCHYYVQSAKYFVREKGGQIITDQSASLHCKLFESGAFGQIQTCHSLVAAAQGPKKTIRTILFISVRLCAAFFPPPSTASTTFPSLAAFP